MEVGTLAVYQGARASLGKARGSATSFAQTCPPRVPGEASQYRQIRFVRSVTGWRQPRRGLSSVRYGLRTARSELVEEAGEVVDVEDWGEGRTVTVGEGAARRVEVVEADEVVDVEERGEGGTVAVGIARRGRHGEVLLDPLN